MATSTIIVNPAISASAHWKCATMLFGLKTIQNAAVLKNNGLNSGGKNRIEAYPFTEPVKAPETTYRCDKRKMMTTGTIMINPATAASAYWKWIPPGFGLKPG